MTSGTKKILIRITGGLVFLFTLLVAGVMVLPSVIESQGVKDKLAKEIFARVGGNLKYQDIKVTFLPYPHLQVRNASFSIPDKVDLSSASISVIPELLPIFSGNFQIHRFSLDAPEVKIHLPDDPAVTPQEDDTSTFDLSETIKTAVQHFETIAGNSIIRVTNGRITLMEENKAVTSWHEINLTYERQQNLLGFSLGTKSSFYDQMDGTLHIDPRSLDIKGSIDIAGTHIPEILSRFLPQNKFGISQGDLGMDLKFSSQDLKTFQADLTGKILKLGFSKTNKNGVINNIDFLAGIAYAAGQVTIDLNKLHMGQPDLDFSGSMGFDPASLSSTIVLTSNKIDIKPIRDIALMIAHDIPAVPMFFNILKQGQINDLDITFKGPLDNPAKSEYRIKSRVNNVVLVSDILPETITISSGSIDLSSNDIVFKDLMAGMMDISISATGELKNFLTENRQLTAQVNGDIGEKSLMWGLNKADLSQTFQIKTPLTIPHADIASDFKGMLNIRGTINPAQGPEIIVDLKIKPEEIMISKLTLKDSFTDSLISFKKKGKKIDASLKGKLGIQTLNPFLSHELITSGWIDGDMRVSVPMDSWADTKVTGKITGKDIKLPIPDSDILELKQFSINSSNDLIKIDSADLQWGEDFVQINGTASSTPGALAFNINADADAIDIEKLLAKIKQEQPETIKPVGTPDKESKKFMYNGSVNLKIDRLKYKNYYMDPFQGEIIIKENQTAVKFLKSKLCNIEVSGNVSITKEGLDLHIIPNAANIDFKQTLECLTLNEQVAMEGTLDLDGNLSAKGNPAQLLSLLNGPLNLKATNGQIYKANSLAKILALVNVTEIFAGKYPGLTKEGLSYTQVDLNSNFENGVLTFTNFTLDSPSMRMACLGTINFPEGTEDLTVLVAPLKTVDRIVKKLPLIGEILDGTLFSIPIRVKGRIEDPVVTIMPLSGVGEDIASTMKKALQVPVKIIQPTTDKP
jgi:hypothetical protein